jgi:hypothetical protein
VAGWNKRYAPAYRAAVITYLLRRPRWFAFYFTSARVAELALGGDENDEVQPLLCLFSGQGRGIRFGFL